MIVRRKEITFDRFIRGCIALAIAIAILMLLDRLSNVLLPFFVAWLLAYFIHPFVHFLQYKCRLKFRFLAIIVALLIVTLVCIGIIYLLIPPMVSEMLRIKDLIAEYFANNLSGSSVPAYINNYIREHFNMEQLTALFQSEDFLNGLRQALPRLWSVISGSIDVMLSAISLLMTLLYTIFILIDYESMSSHWVTVLPKRYRSVCTKLLTDIKDSMNKYFRGQAIVAFCVGILFCIGFLIIGFPMPIALGLFIGLLNMVPYLQLVAIIPTVALAILEAYDTGSNFWIILFSALLVFAVVQIIQDAFLTPRIMGKVTGLSPAIILLSLSIWGSLMGIMGMIIALPLTTLLISYYQKYIIEQQPLFHDDDKDEQASQNTQTD